VAEDLKIMGSDPGFFDPWLQKLREKGKTRKIQMWAA